MIDKLRLEYERKKKGYSTDEFCEKINMSRSAYYRKCNGESEFTRAEMLRICDVLELSSPMDIFFTKEVS